MPNNKGKSSTPNLGIMTFTSGGSLQEKGNIQVQYSKRIVKQINIMEDELDKISIFNSYSTVAFSVASFLLALILGLWGNWLFSSQEPAETKFLFWLSLFSLVFIVAATFFGFHFLGVKNNDVERIKSQSKPIA